MSISEPEAWAFSDSKSTKLHISNLDSSSSDDSSDDEQLFSKMKTLKRRSLKEVERENFHLILFSSVHIHS